jgi:hypothetical protein
MGSKNNPKARENDIVVQELKNEVILYDLVINQAYCLNETSAMVWNLCDGQSSVSDITRQLSKKLNQPVTDDLVWLALDRFKTANLLSDNNEIEIEFNGLSRRDVIRKIGFASMIALPVISSLVAPTAAIAQSAACLTSGQSCPTAGVNQCCDTLACTLLAGPSSFGFCSPCRSPGQNINGCIGDESFCQSFCNSRANVCCSGTIDTVFNTILVSGNPLYSCLCS